jgi:hypothetical protein
VAALLAPVLALLLWTRHRRARFAAYIFFSGVAIRAAVTGAWRSLLFAVLAVALMQTPPALRAWPRLRARWPLPRAGLPKRQDSRRGQDSRRC